MGGHPPRNDSKREKLRERLTMVRMWKLVETLELSEQQSMIFFPIINSHEETIDSLHKNMRLLTQKLEKALLDENPEEMENILDSLSELKSRMVQEESDFYDQLRNTLTLEQQAKYVLFEGKWREELRKLFESGEMPPGEGPHR